MLDGLARKEVNLPNYNEKLFASGKNDLINKYFSGKKAFV
jgi:hypothetical protein